MCRARANLLTSPHFSAHFLRKFHNIVHKNANNVCINLLRTLNLLVRYDISEKHTHCAGGIMCTARASGHACVISHRLSGKDLIKPKAIFPNPLALQACVPLGKHTASNLLTHNIHNSQIYKVPD